MRRIAMLPAMTRIASVLLFVGVLLLSTAHPTEASPNKPSVSPHCLGDHVSLSVQYTGARNDALQIYLDLSSNDDSWAPGSFTSVGPLYGGAGHYDWPGLMPSTSYYIRVNQQLQDGSWDGGPAQTFTTPACALPSAASFQLELLGFTDSPSNAASVVPSRGTLNSCTPPGIFAYLKFTNVADASQFTQNFGLALGQPATWAIDGAKITYPSLSGRSGNTATGVIVVGIPTSVITNTRPNAAGAYDFTYGSGDINVTGSVTITC
jgi:hypothetical protein